MACPKCAAKLRVPSSGPSATVKPALPQRPTTPTTAAPSELLKIRCPCGQVLSAKKSAAGQTIACPKCAAKLRVPGAAPQPVSNGSAAAPLAKPLDFDPFTDSDFQTANPLAPASRHAGPVNPYASSSPHSLGAHTGGGQSDAIRRENLSHEASVRSIGLLYLIGAVLMMFVGLVGVIMGIVTLTRGGDAATAGVIAIVVSIVYSAMGGLNWFIGSGLRNLQNWARITAGIFAIPGLLGIPVGTLISAYFLYILLSKKGEFVCSEHYRRVVASTPHIKYKTSIVIWIFVGCLVLLITAGVVAAILAGGQPRNP